MAFRTQRSTEKLSCKLALSPQLALQFRASAAQGTECLLSLGVPPFWTRAAADWHRCAAFHIPGSPDMVVTHAGTKPGDPLADLIFCIAFFQCQQELQQALLDEASPGPFLLEQHDGFVESMPFGAPAFFDDFFVASVNDSPAGLLGDVQKTVACLISVGHRFGISINTSEGKTEAMIHLVGSTAKETLSALHTTRPPDAPRHLLGLLELHQVQHIGLVNSCKRLGVKAAPTLQSQRAQESQHRATSARHAFRALSAKKAAPWLPQPATQRPPYMVQEHGRNTLSARAEPSTRQWSPSGVLSARASTWEKLHCGLCGLPKAWHPYP